MTAQRPRTALDYAVAYSEAKHRDDPQPAEQRHTVDTITSDALDALYDEREQLLARIGNALAVLAPYDWPHAQVNAARVRAALDEPREPTT